MAHTFAPPPDSGMSFVLNYWGTEPPDADPDAIALMAHFAQGNRASNVYIMQDGTVTTQHPPNWDPNDPTGPYAWVWNYAGSTQGVPFNQSFSNPASLQVKTVYYGAHRSPCSDADFVTLTNAGYGAPDLV